MSNDFEKNLSLLSSKKIYFGHQSVGQNMIDGLLKLSATSGEELFKVVSLHDNLTLGDTYFAHSFVGKNTDASSKCTDFKKMIEKHFSTDLDFAILKFCFVDIRREHDAQTIFNLYKSTVDTLIAKHPHTTFIHTTVPVTSQDVSLYLKLRRMVKKIMGRRDYSPMDNIRRMQYNELIRKHYKTQFVFDIAKIESTYPNGEREIFSEDGFDFESLIFDYTDDAAHLNDYGSKLIASKLVEFMANIINPELSHTN